jgi:phage shock protein A
MSDDTGAKILKEIQGVRADMDRMRNDVSALRSEVAALRQGLDAAAQRDGVAEVRQLWQEGLASGDAGELDEVIDRILDKIPARTPAA